MPSLFFSSRTPWWPEVKGSSFVNVEDLSDPGSGRSWEKEWQPTLCTLPENPMGGGSRVATVHVGYKESDTYQSDHFHFLSRTT